MVRLLVIGLFLVLFQTSLSAQDPTVGKFCLTYKVQPIVEAYIDSLQSYLRWEFQKDSVELDSTTEEYIEHFSSMVTRKSKCVYFHPDSVLIQEIVDDRATNTYLILPEENAVVYRLNQDIKKEPYFLEEDSNSGNFEYSVREDRSDTKLIEGFPCYRMEITEIFHPADESAPNEKKYVVYVTDAIPVNGNFVLGINMSQIIGCPLEVQEPLNTKVRISYQASGLTFSIPGSIFQAF
ncbi:MAG: hypothetical protein OEQ53_06110 [Saprospiraceae bacterium]|nr:hypothetical protein [Saprospiraceae bacterium]